ncbi:MAG: hypothetical protein JXR37_09415 [Kiritimatiellae bacterium]|nr:hypothetical protein [Kiritimatiellia bacterium]
MPDEAQWSRRGPVGLQIGAASFGILALELALIRWTSTQIRVFAYFNNLVLIGAFLGMGLGVALGRRHERLVQWVLPALLILSIPLAFSEGLGLVRMAFPDKAVSLWGGENYQGGALRYGLNLAVFVLLFCGVVAVFVFAGAPIGSLFPRIPALRAYSANLLGSLLGIIALTAATYLNAGPPVWLLVGALPFAWLSRKRVSLPALAGVVLLGWYSVKGAVYSPYNRIDIQPVASGHMLLVNRDFHQFMHDLSDANLADGSHSTDEAKQLAYLRDVYDLPFRLNAVRGSALIVGAGTGNDVQAALRHGYACVYSVDIDARIIELGTRLHPEHPYADPAVIPVVNDARAFFMQYRGPPFDVVSYGLLDSHAMFSSMSSLRLDNYVYTEEGIRAAWQHVAEHGHMTITFSVFAGDWIADRLYWTIAAATGREPIAVYHGMHHGATYLVARDGADIDRARLAHYPPRPAKAERIDVRTTSDDWPFLYVRPGVFPLGYVIVLAAVMLLALMATPLAFGRRAVTSDFDPILFFMGAAFLLIETRGVTSLSLLFGSTWVVNSAIFGGILVMVLAANLAVQRFNFASPAPWFVGLLLSVLLLWRVDTAALAAYSLWVRGVIGALLNALPIGFAGIIFSIFLARSRNPSASLGSNLLGSVAGGCLEYLSMSLGLRALVLLALVFYLSALLWFRRGTQAAQGEAGAGC